MRTIRLTLSALGGALLVACASKAVLAPDGAVLGRWGGEGAEMVASRDFIDVRYGCELFRTVGPLIPDAAGQFALQLAPRTVGRAVSATLSGTLVGQVDHLRCRHDVPGGAGGHQPIFGQQRREPELHLLELHRSRALSRRSVQHGALGDESHAAPVATRCHPLPLVAARWHPLPPVGTRWHPLPRHLFARLSCLPRGRGKQMTSGAVVTSGRSAGRYLTGE